MKGNLWLVGSMLVTTLLITTLLLIFPIGAPFVFKCLGGFMIGFLVSRWGAGKDEEKTITKKPDVVMRYINNRVRDQSQVTL